MKTKATRALRISMALSYPLHVHHPARYRLPKSAAIALF